MRFGFHSNPFCSRMRGEDGRVSRLPFVRGNRRCLKRSPYQVDRGEAGGTGRRGICFCVSGALSSTSHKHSLQYPAPASAKPIALTLLRNNRSATANHKRYCDKPKSFFRLPSGPLWLI